MHDYWGHGYREAINLGCIGADAGSARCDLCRLFSQVCLRFQDDEVENKQCILSILSSVYKNSIRRRADDLFDTPTLVVSRCHRTIEVSLKLQFIYPTFLLGNSAARPRPQLAGYTSNRANHPLPLKSFITVSDMHDRLNEYSKRELTYESDALSAIAGVLSAFVARNVIDGHVWGIPIIKDPSYHRSGDKAFRPMPFSARIAHGLCWVQRPGTGSTSQNLIRRRVGFPSWSWVGWVGLHSWKYLTPVNDGIGWPTSQPFVEPSHYPCTFTFLWDNRTHITLSHGQIDAPFDLDMQGMPHLLVEAWSFSLRFTEFPRHPLPAYRLEGDYPWESAIFWETVTRGGGGKPLRRADDSDPESDFLLWMGLVRWDEGYIHEPAVRDRVLNGTWFALVIGYGITHPGLDILIVEKVSDHFERAGVLRLQCPRPTSIDSNINTLLGANVDKKIFMLG